MARRLVVLSVILACSAAAEVHARKAARKGNLVVNCSITGAEVLINGKLAGRTPLPKPVALAAGSYVVVLKRRGFLDHVGKVNVRAGKTATLVAELVPSSGLLRVSADAARNKVMLDGRAIGKAPLECELGPGEHTVTVTVPGYPDFTQKVSATGGGNTYEVKATFANKKGSKSGLGDLALAPLPSGGDDALPLVAPGTNTDMALVPPPVMGTNGQRTASGQREGSDDLELAPPPVAIDAVDLFALPSAATAGPEDPLSVNTAIPAPATPWYREWWVWTVAAAVLVTAGSITTALLLNRDDESAGGPEPDDDWYLGERFEPAAPQ